jgi:hypothetical protein
MDAAGFVWPLLPVAAGVSWVIDQKYDQKPAFQGLNKLYCIGLDGHIEKRHDYFAPDDLAALDRAREICGPHEIEVWEGARFVARVAGDGTTSMPPTKGPHAESSPTTS